MPLPRYYTHNTIDDVKRYYDNVIEYLEALELSADTTKGYRWTRGSWDHDRDGSADVPSSKSRQSKVRYKRK